MTRNLVLAVAALSGFVATFAASAINVALPKIEEEFHLSAVALDWIPLAYVLAAAALIMAAGRMGDIFGRMKVFTIGLAGFTVFAFAAAFAPSGPVLITLRALQGLTAALLFATNIALATLSQPPATRGRALGLLTAGVYLGSSTGPVLGGLVTDYLGWRALFLLVGGFALVTCVLTFWRLRKVEWKEPREASFDVLGSAVWAVALPALLLGFTFLPELIGILLVVGGSLGLAFFLWWETRAADPILSVNLLRHNRAFAFSNAAALINYSATFALSFLMTLYLHTTPWASGSARSDTCWSPLQCSRLWSPPSPADSQTAFSPGSSQPPAKRCVSWGSSRWYSWGMTPHSGTSSWPFASQVSVLASSPPPSRTWSWGAWAGTTWAQPPPHWPPCVYLAKESAWAYQDWF
jgi:MFS family permease